MASGRSLVVACALAVGLSGCGTSADVAAQAPGGAPSPSPSPSVVIGQPLHLKGERPGCARNQQGGDVIGEPIVEYVDGPDSPRTVADALAEAEQSVTADERVPMVFREDADYAAVGQKSPGRHGSTTYRRYVGFDADGNVRAVQSLQGGVPGGGWVVQSSARCSAPVELPPKTG